MNTRKPQQQRAAWSHVLTLFALWFSINVCFGGEAVPTLDEALNAGKDLWSNAALAQTNGPDYDFFARLLPPLRYVNAGFRYYPIVLCAPAASYKPRLISNGSGINSRASLSTWHELGMPISFYPGEDAMPFGSDTNNLEEPRLLKGYLPVVQIVCHNQGRTFLEETFAPVSPLLSGHGVLFTRFSLTGGAKGVVEARIESKAPLQWVDHSVRDQQGRVLFWCDENWRWNPFKKSLGAMLASRRGACLASATAPLPSGTTPELNATVYGLEKEKCIATWDNILARGMQADLPETRVNDAWKASVIGALMLMDGDRMNYSAGNAYQCMYEAECGDVTRALLLWGNAEARATVAPLLDYGVNKGLRFHDAAFKLQMLAQYYWLTRDRDFILAQRSRWLKAADLLITNREPSTGLLPREAYCGDESQQVHSLNSNANGWRGLHDLAAVLDEIGEQAEAARIASAAKGLREATLDAVAKSEYRDTVPPFIPVALFGDEKPYPVLTASRMGSYWDLMIPYVLGSGIWGCGSEQETSILHYLQEHGGLCMGMIRFDQHSGLFANTEGLDDLYTLRYADVLLQRDEPDRALVTFYGKLAQGMTRNTFISAEGTSLRPLDDFGRPMYLPPVASGNGLFLWLLRGMLIQDHNSNNNGKPDTLRLLFATPRRWLEDGKTIRFEHAPTAFGPVSLKITSRLRSDNVIVQVDLPQRNPAEKTLLRVRLPDGWRAVSATAGETPLPLEKDVLDLSALRGKQNIVVKTRREAAN